MGEDRSLINVNMHYLQLEPIGMFFMGAFILIMAVQFYGMIQHRLMTLSHIVASTNKNFNVKEPYLLNRCDTVHD